MHPSLYNVFENIYIEKKKKSARTRARERERETVRKKHLKKLENMVITSSSVGFKNKIYIFRRKLCSALFLTLLFGILIIFHII